MRFRRDADHELPAVGTVRYRLRYRLIVGLHISYAVGHQIANTREGLLWAGGGFGCTVVLLRHCTGGHWRGMKHVSGYGGEFFQRDISCLKSTNRRLLKPLFPSHEAAPSGIPETGSP